MQASDKERARQNHRELVNEIVGQLARRTSTADLLFHHAVARRLGLGPADHKCLDVLRDGGSMSSNQLAAMSGLTGDAVTGVVARLERAGYLSREPDPMDASRSFVSSWSAEISRPSSGRSGKTSRRSWNLRNSSACLSPSSSRAPTTLLIAT